MAQAERRTVKMEERRLALGMHQCLGVHGPPLLRLAPGFQRQTGEEELLVGAGIQLMGHDGALHK
ncbi:hypothetical protein D3C78_1958220 [compost metagenome]